MPCLTKAFPEIDAAGNSIRIEFHVDVADGGGHTGEDRCRWRFGDDPRSYRCLDHRQRDPAMRPYRVGQRLVTRMVVQRRFREQHVHCHRPRARFAQSIEQFRMHRPRPRPATDPRNAGVVDGDHHHILVGMVCRHRHGAVVDDLIDTPQPPEIARTARDQCADHQNRKPFTNRTAYERPVLAHNASRGTSPSHHGKGAATTKRCGAV